MTHAASIVTLLRRPTHTARAKAVEPCLDQGTGIAHGPVMIYVHGVAYTTMHDPTDTDSVVL